jgi:regulator of replication initiation timing
LSGEETRHLRLTVEAMVREIAQLHRENLHMRKALRRAVERLERENKELRGALSQADTDMAEEAD